ncbi:MAG: Na+/H+ antiporter subunit E [Opitutaceae bacterium]|jgi:multisubunit Na+/H+ antiporter MnhE subunit|nr:Na+/H+ antiporter subunit E [Opitutaceae bacterium]
MSARASAPSSSAAGPAPVSAALAAELRVGRDREARPVWRRVPGFTWFLLCFTRELILANVSMAKVVLFQRTDKLAPEFFYYDITGLRSFEIVILTHCISLTPGTTSVEIDDAETSLLVHGLDLSDSDAVCRSIKETLERPMLAWTR